MLGILQVFDLRYFGALQRINLTINTLQRVFIDGAKILASCLFGDVAERFPQVTEERRQPMNPTILERFGQRSREHDPVYEGVPGPRRSLGEVAEYSPLPISRPAEVGGGQVQVPAAGQGQPVAGSQEAGVRVDEFGR